MITRYILATLFIVVLTACVTWIMWRLQAPGIELVALALLSSGLGYTYSVIYRQENDDGHG